MSENNEAPTPISKFAYPFSVPDTSNGNSDTREAFDPQEYYEALAQAEDGFYPIGYNGQWHGGIHFGAQTGQHLAQDGGVRCIADGEVIAWKIDEEYPRVEYASCGAATYSTGFVLVRHRLQLPRADREQADNANTDQGAAAGQQESGQQHEPSLLFYSLYIHLLDWAGYSDDTDKVRPAFWGQATYLVGEGANDSDRNRNPYIPEGGVGLNLRNATDAIVGVALRGTRLHLGGRRGTTGYYAVTGVENGTVQPADLDLAGVHAYKDELTPVPAEPPEKDEVVIPTEPVSIAAGDLIGHLGQYQRYIDMDPMGSSCHERPLMQVDVFTPDDIESFIEQSRERAAQLSGRHKTLLLIERGAKLIRMPEGEGTPTAEQLAARRDHADGPEVAHPRVIPIQALGEAITGEDGTRWWSVEAGNGDGESVWGWACERDHANIRLCTPWDWPGFEIIQVDDTRPDRFYANQVVRQGDAAPDEQSELEQRGEGAETGPLFRKLYELIDLNGDEKIISSEMRRALAKPWLAQAISHLIVGHESEWSGPMDKWNEIDELIPEKRKKDWNKEKERIESLLWWGETKGSHGLPESEPLSVYNFHPVGFVTNFKSTSNCVPLRKAQELALRVSGGYEGRGNLDYHALADDFDDQGMSFGLIQWNFGQNTLGPILLQMYDHDSVAFENSFPPGTSYQDLETNLVNGDQQAQLTWVRNILRTNRAGWLEAFHNLGDVEAFQAIQLQGALEYHDNVMECIRIMRRIAPDLMREILVTTYVALYDLCVQQGSIDRGQTVNNITSRHASESPRDQVEFLTVVVQERARTANSRWRADAMSRRMGIIQQAPYTAREGDHSATRGNPNFHLLEDYADRHVCEL